MPRYDCWNVYVRGLGYADGLGGFVETKHNWESKPGFGLMKAQALAHDLQKVYGNRVSFDRED
jgi:hypothetical protein